MNDKKPLDFCKRCTKRTFNKQIGLVSGLTNQKPLFEIDCKDFEEEPIPETKVENKKSKIERWKIPLIIGVPSPQDKFRSKIVQADEKKLILKHTAHYSTIFWGVLVLIGYFSFVVPVYRHDGPFDIKMLLIGIFSVSFFIGIYQLIMGLFFMNKKWIFDREHQLVTVPGKFSKKDYTIPFDRMELSGMLTGMSASGTSHSEVVVFIPAKGVLKWFRQNYISLVQLGFNQRTQEHWSFYSWYMDQNRPLPPGKIFDHCRAREFETRKAQGFPLPMYYSLVPTPEANTEFQKERDRVWKDETFCPDINKYGVCDLTPKNFSLPQGSKEYHDKQNPEHWERKNFEDPSHFKYAPEVDWLRYAFNDGKVVYTMNILNSVLVPPPGEKYTVEYFRYDYIDAEKYYNK